MSRNHRGIEDSLRLVGDLGEAARAYVEGMVRFRETAEKQRVRDEARSAAAQGAERERQAAERRALEEAHQGATARLTAHREVRLARIRSAERAARKKALEAVDADEGRRKFELQREMLRATREMEAGLAAADASLAGRREEWAVLEAMLVEWDTRARTALSTYGEGFVRRLVTTVGEPELEDSDRDAAELLKEEFGRIEEGLAAWKRRVLPRLQGWWPLWLILVLAPVPLVPVLQDLEMVRWGYYEAAGFAAAVALGGIVLFLWGRGLSRSAGERVVRSVVRARLLHRKGTEASERRHRRERETVEERHAAITRDCTSAWNQAIDDLAAAREAIPVRTGEKAARVMARLERQSREAEAAEARRHQERMEALRREGERRGREVRDEAEARRARSEQEVEVQRAAFVRGWEDRVRPWMEAVREAQNDPAARVPSWEDGAGWEDWQPPSAFSGALRVGWLDVDLARLAGQPVEAIRAVPLIPPRFRLPLILTYPAAGSMLVETPGGQGREVALSALNQVLFRLLASVPPGRVDLTILDPVGLGQSFAGLMHLADEAEHLLHGRIWTQGSQIESRLGELCDHLEKVIQMYLRDEFATIAEYNERAGKIAEKYRFLVVADFPSGFSELALRRLRNLVVNGARCGVYLLMHWDPRALLPGDVPAADLRAGMVRWMAKDQGFQVHDWDLPGMRPGLEAPPGGEAAMAFLQRVARLSRDSDRVEIPFDQVAPTEAQMWSVATTTELRVPIGRTGATKLQYLSLGQGTRQHALIAGKTGSGKSTLFHVIITNLALWCRPGEVEFYLIDFKKGVEFKCYGIHRLPHARVVAIESDREFGFSVLQRLDDELRRRGELFRARGVQDLAAYRACPGAEVLPRVLLAIDEFQEFFVEEDRLAQNASVLLDRIVRQGRAFGMHVLLGSQTLGGAYTVARSTLGQMVVRIALQCNEADAFLIMDEENPAPRLLSRPGEGIYNDAAGAREANSPFQTVWLSDAVRDAALRRIADRARLDLEALPGPVVFEGNSPAEVRENPLLTDVLAAVPAQSPVSARVWLGSPNAIKGPTEAIFDRRSGSHLLMVGQRDDAALAMLGIALVTLAAQHPRGSARFIVLDGTTAPGSAEREFLERAVATLPGEVTLGRAGEVDDLILGVAAESKARGAATDSVPTVRVFLLIHGLQGLRALRLEDDFSFSAGEGSANPGVEFRRLLVEGPGQGIHVLASCDTYGAVTRFLGRKALAEFGARVLFQMSANDSASLVDSPAASRLGLHRALYFQEREGHTELFRPYALPDRAWLESVADAFRRRGGGETGAAVP